MQKHKVKIINLKITIEKIQIDKIYADLKGNIFQNKKSWVREKSQDLWQIEGKLKTKDNNKNAAMAFRWMRS